MIDFDITSTKVTRETRLQPGRLASHTIALDCNERMTMMGFKEFRHSLRFQQALTDFKVWAFYTGYGTLVSFVGTGFTAARTEEALLQL